MSSELVLEVSDFVAVFNQTLSYAYPTVTIQGELANFRVSKNRWVYFDLKDEFSSVKFFGTVYQLPGPLEDGLMLQVNGAPKLHPQYGFSITIQNIQPVGEGSIKKAMALLEAKLTKEGLFDDSRKRSLPYPPKTVGLIASSESAAYHDFCKILNARWGGVEVYLADVQVQGESSPSQLISALEYFNSSSDQPDVIVMTRGGGSPEDLAAFSTEQVTRAVAASRIPTLVAVGHEIDVSLAELAADKRASTPSNAAELLVPDRKSELEKIRYYQKVMIDLVLQNQESRSNKLLEKSAELNGLIEDIICNKQESLKVKIDLLGALNPKSILDRGYAIVRDDNEKPIKSTKNLKNNQQISVQLKDGKVKTKIFSI